MFNYKYLLYVFLIAISGGCSQALFAAAEANHTMVLPTLEIWEERQKLARIPAELITPAEYVESLRKEASRERELRITAAAQAQLGGTGPAREMSPEEWAQFIQGIPRGAADLPLCLAELTCADLGIVGNVQTTIKANEHYYNINIEPGDTWLILKNKTSAATGIPIKDMLILRYGRLINELKDLLGWRQDQDTMYMAKNKVPKEKR
ncbi:MAG: hypothetical protein NT124_04595 [Candidatus Dependentiae bacterium]|nr:hypothetical protein [Candidatus Dependentiae bacterium]